MASLKKQLLVTLADRNFLDQAKQLFSSAYHNAGWRGDYLLLAHDVPEADLAWFRNKGILIYECTPLAHGQTGCGHGNYPAVVLDKFYLFTPYFRQWQKILFLDADIIVQASLDRFLPIAGLAAPNATDLNLKKEFNAQLDPDLWAEMNRAYPLRGPSFNTGVLAFDTGLITDDLFARLVAHQKKFGHLSRCGEEGAFNIVFYQNWQKLPLICNVYPEFIINAFGVRKERLRAVILHFACHVIKPWLPASPYYEEWKNNLHLAEQLDPSRPLPAISLWSDREVRNNTWFLHFRMLFPLAIWAKNLRDSGRWLISRPDWLAGQIGRLVKRLSPAIYYKIVRLKKNNFQSNRG
ncbi:MAG: glycosyltransferase [Patescibacteria group bacterium]